MKLETDVAVVGLACRFPGASSATEYWENLLSQHCAIQEVPQDRWQADDYFCETNELKNKVKNKWAGFMPEADHFDAEFFGISPREALQMCPQQRLSLQTVWHCLEDAGYNPLALDGRNIGVFVGASGFDYKEKQESCGEPIASHAATGIHNTVIANRISYYFNWHGPSIVTDGACAGSLVSIHQAVDAIRNKSCEAAIAGGTALLATPTTFIRFGKAGMLSPSGLCKPFDADADGYIRGEGIGYVYLKALNDAIRDNDDIYLVIKGSAVNHSGRTRSLTSPSAIAQSKVITEAVKCSGVDVRAINYIEAHGTGTPLGDPIEIIGLSRAFSQLSRNSAAESEVHLPECKIGSVKSNIGHLEPAAGIASFIKVALCCKHKMLPGVANFKSLNPRLKIEKTNFSVLDKTTKWDAPKINGLRVARTAGISSFNFGGLNCHIVVQEPPPNSVDRKSVVKRSNPDSGNVELLSLSANDKKALRELVSRYVDQIEREPLCWREICTASNERCVYLKHRKAFVARSSEELLTSLTKYLSQNETNEENKKTFLKAGEFGFLFTGQGAQYPGMGKELYGKFPRFRKNIERCSEMLSGMFPIKLEDLLFYSDADVLSNTLYTQPALFAFEYSLSKALIDSGFKPMILMGHSLGEIIAMAVAEVMSLEDAIKLVCKRAQLMQSLPLNETGMLSVVASKKETMEIMSLLKLDLDFAAINGPKSVVVSGTLEEISRLHGYCVENGIKSQALKVSHGYHSHHYEKIAEEFEQFLSDFNFRKPSYNIISNITARFFDDHEIGREYFSRHLLNTVQFEDGIRFAETQSLNAWIEVGPKPVLINLARNCKEAPGTWLAAVDPNRAEQLCIASLFATAFESGLDVDLAYGDKTASFSKIKLPSYPFSTQSYWVKNKRFDYGSGSASRWRDSPVSSPLLGSRVPLANTGNSAYYHSRVDLELYPYLADHRVNNLTIFPAAGFVSVAIAAIERLTSVNKIQLSNIAFKFALQLNEERPYSLQTIVRTNHNDKINNYKGKFEIWSAPDAEEIASEDWVLNCEGDFYYGDGDISDDDVLPLPETETLSEVVYDAIENLGVEYSGDFRGLKFVEFSEDSTLATLDVVVPKVYDNSLVVYPPILDSVFQTALLQLIKSNKGLKLLPLPLQIETMSIFGDLNQAKYVSVETSDGNGNGEYVSNYRIYSKFGNCLCHLKSLQAKCLDLRNLLSKNGNDNLKSVLSTFTPNWQRLSIRDKIAGLDHGKADKPALILHLQYRSDWGGILEEKISSFVKISKSLTINEEADLGELVGLDDEPFNIVIIDSSATENPEYTLEYIEKVYAKADVLRRLCQVLANITSAIDIQHFSFSNNSLIESDTPASACGVGMLHTLANEVENISTLDIKVSSPEAQSLGLMMTIEILKLIYEGHFNKYSSVLIQDGFVYHQKIYPLVVTNNKMQGFRRAGTYVILGGAGGIGRKLSEYLIANYDANVVWFTRSKPSHEINKSFTELSGRAGRLDFQIVDVNDQDSVNRAFESIYASYGDINGVIHSAVVLQDQVFQNLTTESLKNVLLPKVSGSVSLVNGLKRMVDIHAIGLDFVYFFSSANVYFCNPGQANYVAACHFKDSFARFAADKLKIPVKIINWGYWGDVGVVASEEYEKALAAKGIDSIKEEEGLALIEKISSASVSQVMAIKADKGVLEEIGVDFSNPLVLVEDSVLETPIDKIRGAEKGKEYIPDQIAEIDFYESNIGLNRFAALVIALALRELDEELLPGIREGKTPKKIKAKLHSNFQSWLEAALCHINNFSMDPDFNDALESAQSLGDDTLFIKQEFARNIEKYPAVISELSLVRQCGSKLREVLSGELAATNVLFPDGSMSYVEAVYSDSPMAYVYNEILASSLVAACSSSNNIDSKIKILEVGAGTGGTSRFLLKALSGSDLGGRVEYWYTDVSPAFLQFGEERFSALYPNIQFRLFDVEKVPNAQDVPEGEFDIVVAANVLHATNNIQKTLVNVRSLLKSNGLILINELAEVQPFLTATFGLLNGWWLPADMEFRLPHGPLLSASNWRHALFDTRFTNIHFISVPEKLAKVGQLQLICAQADAARRSDATLTESDSSSLEIFSNKKAESVSISEIIKYVHDGKIGESESLLISYLQTHMLRVLKTESWIFNDGRADFKDMLLSEFGVDSLTAMELRNQIKRDFKIDIPSELILGGEPISALIDKMRDAVLLQTLVGSAATHVSDTEQEQEVLVI